MTIDKLEKAQELSETIAGLERLLSVFPMRKPDRYWVDLRIMRSSACREMVCASLPPEVAGRLQELLAKELERYKKEFMNL